MERIREVNEIYKEQSEKGLSNEYIYNHFIVDRYHISRTTFYSYLTVPYKKFQEIYHHPKGGESPFHQLGLFEEEN
jgi:hypothetical protein